MFLFRKLRFFSHSKCKESQSISDLSSIESLNEVGINNPGYNLKRSKSAEQLNSEITHSLHATRSIHSVNNSIDDSSDDYLQPYEKIDDASKSVRKIAIVNPTTHISRTDNQNVENDPFEEESLYQNVETPKSPPSFEEVEKHDEATGSIYQNVESLVFKTNDSGTEDSTYQNIVVERESIPKSEELNKEFEYEFVQKLDGNEEANQISEGNDEVHQISEIKHVKEGNKPDGILSGCDVNLRQNSTEKKEESKDSQSPSVVVPSISNVSQSPQKKISPKPPKKPKPARPPPPKFSQNSDRYRNRYTSPDLPTQSLKLHEKSLSVDSPDRTHPYDPKRVVDIRGKMLFRNARSASEQIHVIRRSDNIHDYLDMSNSRPGELVVDDTDDTDDTDDYMAMSLEDKCPLDS